MSGTRSRYAVKTHLQCVWRLALCFDRKKNRKRIGSSKNIRRMATFLRNNMTRNKCAKTTLYLSCTCTSVGLCVHGHGAWRLFYLEFSRWDSCTISQGLRRFSENLRWPSRDEMAGCLHGELYTFSSRDKLSTEKNVTSRAEAVQHAVAMAVLSP